jgi:hypothetical protein
MPQIAVSNPAVVINNLAVPVVPNSVSYTEGFGEQNMSVQSAGGGNIDTVFSDNVETHISKVMFTMKNTAENIALIRGWKVNKNANAITVTGDDLNRSFSGMALVSDYEVKLGADTVIELEFQGNPAV